VIAGLDRAGTMPIDYDPAEEKRHGDDDRRHQAREPLRVPVHHQAVDFEIT
jgi:hypothetical protein